MREATQSSRGGVTGWFTSAPIFRWTSKPHQRGERPLLEVDGITPSREERRSTMRGTMLYGPRDVRFEERPDPTIIEPTDAIIRISAACVCGSDLWPYRGIDAPGQPTPMGHEYCGIVEEVGSAVRNIKPGQFVVGSFFASDNTCPNCQFGYQSSFMHLESVSGAQSPF